MNSHDWIQLALVLLSAVASFFGAKHGTNSNNETEEKINV